VPIPELSSRLAAGSRSRLHSVTFRPATVRRADEDQQRMPARNGPARLQPRRSRCSRAAPGQAPALWARPLWNPHQHDRNYPLCSPVPGKIQFKLLRSRTPPPCSEKLCPSGWTTSGQEDVAAGRACFGNPLTHPPGKKSGPCFRTPPPPRGREATGQGCGQGDVLRPPPFPPLHETLFRGRPWG
jgi:hypothetical protein